MRRTVAIVAAVVAFAPPAAAAADATLLRRHQPVLALHTAEQFRPVAVDAFIADAELQVRTASGAWTRADGPLPTADPPGCVLRPCWRLDLRACSARTGVASVACYAAAEARRAPPSVVYAGAVRRSGRIVLQYWYWWSYNFWSGEYPSSDLVWQAHEGDWEVVVVVLDRRARPLFAAYSEHGCGKRRAWDRVPKWRRTHPLVYPALGSHANLFRRGVVPFDLRPSCYPPAGAAILRAALPGGVFERTGGGPRLGPRETRLVRVTATSPSWMQFAGVWGEENVFHAGGTDFGAGAAPWSPGVRELWRDPLRALAKWPRG